MLMWFVMAAVCGGVVFNPYKNVDWQNDVRLKTQLHGHFHDQVVDSRILAYDSAGYDVVSLNHYSGYDNGGSPFTELHWPPEDFVAASTLNQTNMVFIPGAEQVSGTLAHHTLSPFATGYFQAGVDYSNGQELVDGIRAAGGFPIMAHPTVGVGYNGNGLYGVEIFNTFFENNLQKGINQNPEFLAYWDEALKSNPRIVGISVNDWFGPQAITAAVSDAGYVVVLAKDNSYNSLKQAFETSSLLAVKDLGGEFPLIASIDVSTDSILIDTDSIVRWVYDGTILSTGSMFPLSSVPDGANYVRAEIQNGSTTVYTQAFVVPEPNAFALIGLACGLIFFQKRIISMPMRAAGKFIHKRYKRHAAQQFTGPNLHCRF